MDIIVPKQEGEVSSMISRILKAILNFFLDFIEIGVFALVIFVITYIFLFQPHQVKGSSMYPNFHDGEYLLTNKINYRFNMPQRGQVIIFKAPQNEDYDYIKRIIALPDEKIKIFQGTIYINDKVLDESNYLAPEVKTHAGLFLSEGKEFTVPDNEYFVLGDNRDHSSDSRDWGTVPAPNIIGEACFRYWPPSEIGFLKSGVYPIN
jgi:signal peptidase I